MAALPATDEARTHLGRLPSSPADDLALTARSDHSRPCRHFRQPMSPDTSRASAILANKPPRAHGPLRLLPAMSAFPATDEPRTHLGHLPSSPADDLRALDPLRSLPAMSTFPATDETRTNLGRSPSSPTDGLLAHHPLRSSSAMAAFTQPMEPGHTSGARPPLVHHRRVTDHRCPLLPLLPGKSNAPFPTRRTSPVMTNDRVSPLSPLP
ncbi:hypothetical protein SAMN05428964_102104 [Thalassospira xiamenensis]|uniref:Uncharacterized protein n=1 Tax=Thalassospira xiamenensis TaxID=220697 RepID=A0A285T258_9PROT|nr:hypothetical protein SAMN05428964_102104 [Thalassospira xiamenensis]